MLFFLSYKVGSFGGFLFGKTEFLFAKLDASHKEDHVVSEGTHCLKSLKVVLCFTLGTAVNTVPVLTGCQRHTAYGEILIELVKGGRATAPSCNRYRSADLHSLVRGGAVEKSVEQSNERCIGTRVINGRCNHQAVALVKQGMDGIDDIVNNATLVTVVTGCTSKTAANTRLTDLNYVSVYLVFIKYLSHLVKCERGSVLSVFFEKRRVVD